jgi:alkylation response protein AidB-like acyl-CoA dehydrogenase
VQQRNGSPPRRCWAAQARRGARLRITFNRLLHCPSVTGLPRLALRLSLQRALARQQFGASPNGSSETQRNTIAKELTGAVGR